MREQIADGRQPNNGRRVGPPERAGSVWGRETLRPAGTQLCALRLVGTRWRPVVCVIEA